MILDDRGKAPNFVVIDEHIVHQPTGTKEPIFGREDMRDMNIQQALLRLKVKLKGNDT